MSRLVLGQINILDFVVFFAIHFLIELFCVAVMSNYVGYPANLLLGPPKPEAPWEIATVVEFLGALAICLVLEYVGTSSHVLTITTITLNSFIMYFMVPHSSAGMNPAAVSANALFFQDFEHSSVYWIGPLGGYALGGIFISILSKMHKDKDKDKDKKE